MEVAGDTGPGKVVVDIGALSGSHAHFPQVPVLLQVLAEALPRPFNRLAVRPNGKQSFLHPHLHGIAEHGTSRGFPERPWFIYELTPKPVFPLVVQQCRHHAAVPCKNSIVVRIALGEFCQQHGQSRGHPSVPPAPEERTFRAVVKQPVGLLQFFQVRGHHFGCPVQILRIAGHPVRLDLQRGEHPDIIYPVTRLARRAIRQRVLPLPVGIPQSLLPERFSHPRPVQFQRQDAVNVNIHVICRVGDGTGPLHIIPLGQPFKQRRVLQRTGQLHRPKPRTNLGIMDPMRLGRTVYHEVGTCQQVFNYPPPYPLRAEFPANAARIGAGM